MKLYKLSAFATAVITAISALGSGSMLTLSSFAAAEQSIPYTKYTITETELTAAEIDWRGCESVTVYARVTEGGPDSKISASVYLGPDGMGKTSTKCLSGKNVLVGNAIQDNLVGLAGSGIYAFPDLTINKKCEDKSEWQESYEEEITITVAMQTADTDCELLGISFDKEKLYVIEEGFSPDNAAIESKSFDIIKKTQRDLLKMTLDYCDGMQKEKYLPESWEELQSALIEAEAVYEKEGEEDSAYINARAALEKVKCNMRFADTDTPEDPLPFRELTTEEIVFEMGVGINLGNTMDGHSGFSPNETSWQSVKTTKEYIKALHDAGYNTVRIPVTWGAMIDRDTYELNERWLNRVQEIVDYCISLDMYAIINIHHDGAEQSGWLRVAAEDIDAVYEKFECVWRNIAERFKDYDEHLIFECMNEITCMKDDMKNSQEAVNKDTPIIVNLNQIFVNVVRSTGSNNEKRWLAAVAHYANSGNHKDFVLPTDTDPDDPHIMFAAHIYKANTNTTWTYEEVYQVVNGLKMMADKFDVPMYLGEYGNRTQLQEGTATGYNDAARAYFSEVVHRACQTAGVVPVVWDQGYGTEGKYQTGLFTYWDRELCVPLFKSITDAMMRGIYLPNSELNDSWDYTDVIESPEIVPITAISLSTYDVDIDLYESFIVDTVTAPTGSNDVVLWSSDDESIATVTRGIIRGRGIGRTTIRAYTQNGTVTKEIEVTVNALSGENIANEILAPDEVTIEKGKSLVLGAEMPEGTEGFLTYKTSNPNVITVSPTGRIFAVGSGVAYIIITTDSGVTKTIRVYSAEDGDIPEVKSETAITARGSTSITLDAVGDRTTLYANYDAGFTCFVSADSSIAAVDSNRGALAVMENTVYSMPITAMSVGTTTVTAITDSGTSVSFEVTVLHEAPSGLDAGWVILICAAGAAIIALCFAAIKKMSK